MKVIVLLLFALMCSLNIYKCVRDIVMVRKLKRSVTSNSIANK